MSKMKEEQIWKEFHEALEGLKDVHTREELEGQRKKVSVVRERLWKVSEEFRHEVRTRMEEARLKSEARMATMKLKTESYMREADMARQKAVDRKPSLSYPQTMTRLRTAKAPMPSDDKEVLVCPECYTANVNWLKVNRKRARKEKLPKGVKEIPWCFRCKKRMIRLTRKEVNDKKREKKEAKLRMAK